MTTIQYPFEQRTLLGHPTGLFTLFFAEMWERFSYYGMRALLLFYMLKGFLGYGDEAGYGVYGAYTALVYMTPFFGGMLADRLLAARRAVVLGGLLMAAGHLTMTIETEFSFFAALALLIVGNGFFKPNISTMVGQLYPKGGHGRDGGFTIFYMGVNLGAAMSPLLCGYIGETYGWHYGFGLATIGMLTGLAVFVAPTVITQLLIFSGSVAAAFGLFTEHADNIYATTIHIFVGVALLIAAILSCVALQRGGLPKEAGRPAAPEKLRKPVLGPLNAEWSVYLGSLVVVGLFILLVSGFSMFTADGKPLTIIPQSVIQDMEAQDSALMGIVATVLGEISKPAGLVLFLSGIIALIYLGFETFRLEKIARHRMFVVLILTFFSMLFWAFFEQAGSSINNFTDRNVDRVFEERTVVAEDVGKTITLQPTQEQLGYTNGDIVFTLDVLDGLRDEHRSEKNGEETASADGDTTADAKTPLEIDWVVSEDDIGMGIASQKDEMPASTFQAINPIYILLFGLVFTALWGFLDKIGWEPNTALKFALGLLQLGLGFAALWYGAQQANDRGMVGLAWLFVGYLLHTTGELCLSPVGLSMITKLSPAQLVSTTMGNWFLATAFSQYLAAIIAMFTKVGHGSGGSDGGIPVPSETVSVYGDVFGQIAIAAGISALLCFLISPLLKYWMHEDLFEKDSLEGPTGGEPGPEDRLRQPLSQ